ncbi:hypothetical protein HPB50_003553 [Hyalomma asiaticum]|uniref:Uncharacterized protein n=1 Tax=Hyalomma asiaticum TaxID=266040 RepID=A0ACB7SSG2_HYAAI|nr:hypothetical protein HPB50_003553 [Hyalomma asiaticum]
MVPCQANCKVLFLDPKPFTLLPVRELTSTLYTGTVPPPASPSPPGSACSLSQRMRTAKSSDTGALRSQVSWAWPPSTALTVRGSTA